MVVLQPIFVVGIIAYTLYRIIELFARRTERKMLIEKIEKLEGVDAATRLSGFRNRTSSPYGALRLGSLLLGVGVGGMVGIITQQAMLFNLFRGVASYENREMMSGVVLCCILVFGGIGLVTAFCLERKMRRKDGAEK